MEVEPIACLSLLIQSTWYFQAFSISIFIALVFGLWRIFESCKEHGWFSLIPFFNLYILCKISTSRPFFNFIFLLLPFVNLFFWFKINIQLSHRLKRNTFLGVLTALFPYFFYPLFGFRKSLVHF